MSETTHFELNQFLELIDSDVELFESLMKVFSDDWPNLMTSLRNAIESESFGEIEKLGHRLKGNLRNFYAHDLATKALELEEAGHSKRLLGLDETIDELESGIKKLESELNQVLLSMKSSQA